MSIKRLLYTLFLYVIFPIVIIRLLWRSRANKAYRLRWLERLGFVSQQAQTAKHNSIIWLHAVSVGEVIAAKPLIVGLMEEFPKCSLVVTTTTPTGSDRVNDIFFTQIKSQRLIHVYFPYDLLGSISRFLNAFKPKILIVVETEIWPNLYAKCHQRNIPVIMINARLSDKSMKSYRKVKGLVEETLSYVKVIAVRSLIDADRFSKLGADSRLIEKIGNIKYDLKIDQTQVDKGDDYKNVIKQRPVLVAASTHHGEDKKILFAYKTLIEQFPDLLLVLVPRHPERFDDVYDDCLEQLPDDLNVIKRSDFKQHPKSFKSQIHVIVGDSMGEMQMWYSLADLVFIGGSLVKTGGHNPLEATIFGVPVFSGPHMFNFEDITVELEKDELLMICEDEFGLIEKASMFFDRIRSQNDKKTHIKQLKDKTDKFMQQHQGATARLIKLISKNVTH